MPKPYRLGHEAVLYYSATLATSTTFTIPATVADQVNDVKIVAKNDTPEYTTRANAGVKQYGASLKDLGIQFKFKVPGDGITDAAYDAFRDAWKNGTELAVYALTGATTGAKEEGPGGNWIVASFDVDQTSGAVQFASVELKPSTFNAWHVGT